MSCINTGRREKAPGWTQLARDTEAELAHVLPQSHLGTEWFVTVMAIFGCQLDTFDKREPQLRNCLQ